MTLQKLVEGVWVEGMPAHGEQCRYVSASGGVCETYYNDPEFIE
jgi:hypothetical protein